MDEPNRRNTSMEDATENTAITDPNIGAPENVTIDEDDTSAQNAAPNYDSPGAISGYSHRDEETAAELTADDVNDRMLIGRDDEEDNTLANHTVGWVALALSVISLFWLPIVFGGAGIIVGFVARNRDSKTLGNIAIAVGVLSIIISLFVFPFTR